jgi:hypothetical protein
MPHPKLLPSRTVRARDHQLPTQRSVPVVNVHAVRVSEAVEPMRDAHHRRTTDPSYLSEIRTVNGPDDHKCVTSSCSDASVTSTKFPVGGVDRGRPPKDASRTPLSDSHVY